MRCSPSLEVQMIAVPRVAGFEPALPDTLGRIDPFPHLHVRPADGWVNDPNGIGHWDCRWHVMYQWNPNSPQHGDIHWGHMSSADLLSWRDEGVALRPRPEGLDAAGVWSGVAVPDGGGVALVYSAVPNHAWHAGVAVARRGGDGAWVQPDRLAAEHPDRSKWRDVRDPFLVPLGDRRLGILGAGRTDAGPHGAAGSDSPPRGGAVLVYDADDLDHWTLLGPLLLAADLPDDMPGEGAIWECPQLIPFEGRWLLVVSWDHGVGVLPPTPDGTVPRTLGVTCYLGDLDVSGPVPRFIAETASAFDHGPDFYAPQLVVHGDRVLAWGWSWEGRGVGTNRRPGAEVEASGWAGTVTFPREVVIGPSGVAQCIPARELAGLVGEPLEVDGDDRGFELRTAAPAWTLTADGEVQVDLHDESTGQARPVWSGGAPGAVTVFTDGSIVEVFTGSGSATVRAYPAGGEVWRVRSTRRLAAAVLRLPVR